MRRVHRIALGALAAVAAALAVAVAVFFWGVEVGGEYLRAPLERVLTATFDVPTRIEGPLRLRTGRIATVSADALVLADPAGPAAATLARGIAPRASIDLLALLRRTVALEDVSGERLELSLRRQADGRANWAQLFSSPGESSPVSFAGIARLRIGRIVGRYERENEQPVPFSISELDGAIPLNEPLAASGTAQIAGREIGFDLRSAGLAGLASAAAIPLQGTVHWSGLRTTVDGRLVDGGTRLEATIEATATDAGVPLARLGISANVPDALALRGNLTATATQAIARDLAVSLGRSKASGSASIAWDGPKAIIAIDLAGEHFDAAPFLDDTTQPKKIEAAQEWVTRLESLATGTEATVTLTVDEITGLPVTTGKLRLDLRSGERALAVKAAAVVAGTPIDATLDYDARKPQHTLAARIDSGAASTASLPRESRPSELTVTASGIRGRLRGEGADPGAIVASLQGDLDARSLGWTLARGRQTVKGRFDVVRIALQGSKASSAEVSGTIEGAACSLKASGGAPGPLLAGEPWPLQFSATCPGERVNAKGRIALAERHATAELAFDAVGDRSGPVARAVGLPPGLAYPIAARGMLTLDGTQAQLRLAALRIGRTAGSGEIAHPLGTAGTPRLRLVLATLNLDDIDALGEADAVPGDPLERKVLRQDLRLRDADFDIAADRVDFRGTRLRDLRLEGALRGRRMPAAPFRIEWDGMALRGQFSVDFSGASPRLQIEAAAQDADLRALLAALGIEGARVRAGQLSVSAQAQGERLRDVLASAKVNAMANRARVQLQRPLLPGATGSGTLSATFKTVPGQPSRFTARGEMDGRAIDLVVDGPAFDALARDGAQLPLSVHGTVGDLRIEAEGRFAPGGKGEARVRLAGGRLDHLGNLLGVALPETEPYAAGADLALSPGTIHFSNLDAAFGKSRVVGSLRVDWREGGRRLHSAALRALALHLEDIGAAHWMRGRDAAAGKASDAPSGQRAQAVIERLLERLPATDLDASIEVDALYGGGQAFASGHVHASLNAGRLRIKLQDVRTQDGSVSAEGHVDTGAAPPRFSLRADVRRLEYGALARAMDPASQSNGRVDAVVDLATQGRPGNLLPGLKGTVDVAVYPRGLQSGALGIWGSGLLQAILGAVEGDSRAAVECSVAGFDIKDGVARSDGFFVETTRVRIIGDLQLRLESREISGRIDPRSNEPQFLAIAPTMLVRGTLESPSLSVAPESLVLAPLRFVSSLSPFALDWLNRKDRRSDATADCREAFERMLQARSAAGAPQPPAMPE